jgi:hypothetical protein
MWRVVQGQFDPLALLCAYIIQFKLLMQNLIDKRRKVIGWDDKMLAATAAYWET